MASIGHETSLGLCFNFVGGEFINLFFFGQVGVSLKPFIVSSELLHYTPLGCFDKNLGFSVVRVSNVQEEGYVCFCSGHNEDRYPIKLVKKLLVINNQHLILVD